MLTLLLQYAYAQGLIFPKILMILVSAILSALWAGDLKIMGVLHPQQGENELSRVILL